ncbi:hypothetical protein EV142_108230 [Flavobacterium circumlabens]|uniref:Uncharacterized protein n=1 Tax=Flavobacterium circumlabens TaxID=2133765 RepID=A0ABY2AVB9_9FLAO|nr:hypothetical protein [Flavobacterium circumlabens]TCN53923.1 hypothetical protein EV142_108230 [Flavobacterium circumlabens]
MATNNKPSKETKNEWHHDPKNWKWRIFITIQKIKDYFHLKE